MKIEKMKQIKSKTTRTNLENCTQMRSNRHNQSNEHQHRRLFKFECGAVVSPDTLCSATTWGTSRNAIHVCTVCLCGMRCLCVADDL